MSVIGRPGPANEDERGIKAMAFSSYKCHLVVGDMLGNLRVYQVTSEITQIN